MKRGEVLPTNTDVRKSEKCLDLKPIISIEKGVKKFVNWYKDYYKF